MSGGDSRVADVAKFTSTTHHTPYPFLANDTTPLPEDFTVCIIGASAGIGEAIAYAYAHAGAANIILSSRNTAPLHAVSEIIKSTNIKTKVSIHPCDVSSADSVHALSSHVKTTFARLDVLITNPGYAPPVTLKMHDGEPGPIRTAFDINAVGTWNAAHFFVPLLLGSERGAKTFVAVGSIAACLRRGPIANTGYVVSKMAQVRLVELLGEQYGAQAEGGLLALSVHPGAVMTEMARSNTPDEFVPYLVDDVGLCGELCTWLSRHRGELQWLTGRLISANWDMEQMLERKEEIVEKDLLKFSMTMS